MALSWLGVKLGFVHEAGSEANSGMTEKGGMIAARELKYLPYVAPAPLPEMLRRDGPDRYEHSLIVIMVCGSDQSNC